MTDSSEGGGTGDWAWSRLLVDVRHPCMLEIEKRESLRGVDAGGGVGEGVCELFVGASSHLHAIG